MNFLIEGLIFISIGALLAYIISKVIDSLNGDE
jgi:hypothetical protein